MFLMVPGVLKSQTLYVLDSRSTDGEPRGESAVFSFDPGAENFVYMLIKFPSAYGCNQIKFRQEMVGEPGPVDWVSISPDATWHCHEMYIPSHGDYVLTVFDCNDNVLARTEIKMRRK